MRLCVFNVLEQGKNTGDLHFRDAPHQKSIHLIYPPPLCWARCSLCVFSSRNLSIYLSIVDETAVATSRARRAARTAQLLAAFAWWPRLAWWPRRTRRGDVRGVRWRRASRLCPVAVRQPPCGEEEVAQRRPLRPRVSGQLLRLTNPHPNPNPNPSPNPSPDPD